MESSFETKLKRLQEIVNLLDSAIVSLDESLKLYEEGMNLAIELKKILDEAELKIINLNEYFKSLEKKDLETPREEN
ncbi:MAG: exodeoxyribonuclease VII small subunit [Candidatus Kapaibacteriales bacterium]